MMRSVHLGGPNPRLNRSLSQPWRRRGCDHARAPSRRHARGARHRLSAQPGAAEGCDIDFGLGDTLGAAIGRKGAQTFEIWAGNEAMDAPKPI